MLTNKEQLLKTKHTRLMISLNIRTKEISRAAPTAVILLQSSKQTFTHVHQYQGLWSKSWGLRGEQGQEVTPALGPHSYEQSALW